MSGLFILVTLAAMKHDYNEMFTYDPLDGRLTWKERPRNHFPTQRGYRVFVSRFHGKPAGTINTVGYRQVIVNMKPLLEHRIIWEMHHGPIPDGLQLDHRNGVRHDNRLENLRLATPSQNMINRSFISEHGQGIKFDKRAKKRPWSARVTVKRKTYHLGMFATKEEAAAAQERAAKDLHGEYQRTS